MQTNYKFDLLHLKIILHRGKSNAVFSSYYIIFFVSLNLSPTAAWLEFFQRYLRYKNKDFCRSTTIGIDVFQRHCSEHDLPLIFCSFFFCVTHEGFWVVWGTNLSFFFRQESKNDFALIQPIQVILILQRGLTRFFLVTCLKHSVILEDN